MIKQRKVMKRAVEVHFRLEVSTVDAGCCIAGKRKEEREWDQAKIGYAVQTETQNVAEKTKLPRYIGTPVYTSVVMR